MDSTEMRWSPSRVTSPVRPSGVSATWLGPDFSSPRRTLPAAVTVLPLMVNTETVPSLRFAASARLPCRLIEMPATPAPASSVAMTRGGEDCRSITETLLSGTCLPPSMRIAAVTSAIDSSGATATESGGAPTPGGGAGVATPRGGGGGPPGGAAVTGARAIEPREGALEALGFACGNARAAVQDFDADLRLRNRGANLDRLAGIAQRVVDQVGDGAPHCHPRERKSRHRLMPERHLSPQARIVPREVVEQLVQVVLRLVPGLAAREIQELADHAVDLVDVGDHGLGGGALRAAHLEHQAQARQRRAQIVRNAGKHHGALALHAGEVARHAVEGGGEREQLARAFLGHRLVRLAAAEAPGGARQPGERPGDAEGDEPGAGERQGEQREPPAEPLQTERRREALKRQHRPELVAVDEEADPEAFLAVAGIGEARVFAQRGAHALRDAVKQGIAGQRRQALALGRRVDAQALALIEVDQQLAAAERVGAHQRRAGQVGDAHRLLRKLARARLALVDQVDLEGGEHRGDDQQRDQQERPGEQRHLGSLSGTKT